MTDHCAVFAGELTPSATHLAVRPTGMSLKVCGVGYSSMRPTDPERATKRQEQHAPPRLGEIRAHKCGRLSFWWRQNRPTGQREDRPCGQCKWPSSAVC